MSESTEATARTSRPSTGVERIGTRFDHLSTRMRVLAVTAFAVLGSGVCCYAFYYLAGMSMQGHGVGRWVMLLAPLVTPALLAPLSMIPIERSNHRVARLLDEVAMAQQALAEKVAEHAVVQAQLEELVRRDPLTGVLNRRGFFELWDSLPDRDQVVLTIDVDDFKQVNDRWGHASGDRVLCAIASTLVEAAGPDARVARLGGDEFAVLVEASEHDVYQRLTHALADLRVTLGDGSTTAISSSVGTASLGSSLSIDAALAVADQRMYSAKRSRGSDRDRNPAPFLHAR